MGFLKQLFSRQPRTPTASDEVTRIIDRFTTATLQGVDPGDIGRYPAKQHKVMAFHFGAIAYLCRQYELDDTHTLGVFVTFINKYFNMPVTETGSISERLQGFLDNPDERRFVDAGVEIFRRWYEQDERQAPLELGQLLRAD